MRSIRLPALAPECRRVEVLAGLAEFERELIRTRTGEGRERAKARGVRPGRKPKLTPHQRMEALARDAAGEPIAEIGRSYAVSHDSVIPRDDRRTPDHHPDFSADSPTGAARSQLSLKAWPSP